MDLLEYFNHRKLEIGDIILKCYEAKTKYSGIEDYYYTSEDYDNFIMLASCYQAILRKAWRLFVVEQNLEIFEFWNGFIRAFILQQRILLTDEWATMKKHHKELYEKIQKTSNPKFTEKMFVGFDWKWLMEELKKGEIELG